MALSTFIKSVLVGTRFGEVFPPRDPPMATAMAMDGRTAGLRVLRRYFAELTFYRSGPMLAPASATAETVWGAPIPFVLPEKDIHIEQPDTIEELDMPYVTIRPGPATYETIGLTTNILDETRDVYGHGSVVIWNSCYNETLTLEIGGASKAERRALIAGIEQAMNPVEQTYGLRFRMPDYFDQLVHFVLNGRAISEDASADGRRVVTMEVEMNYTVVSLINYVDMQPVLQVETTDQGAGL